MDESSLKKSFGIRCCQLRNHTGLSQEKPALLINIDRSYYASIETGLRNVTRVNIAKIPNGLRVDLSELLQGANDLGALGSPPPLQSALEELQELQRQNIGPLSVTSSPI